MSLQMHLLIDFAREQLVCGGNQGHGLILRVADLVWTHLAN